MNTEETTAILDAYIAGESLVGVEMSTNGYAVYSRSTKIAIRGIGDQAKFTFVVPVDSAATPRVAEHIDAVRNHLDAVTVNLVMFMDAASLRLGSETQRIREELFTRDLLKAGIS